jgi:hypothetical protein
MTENTGSKISCQYLHFAQTEDIWLKSALEGGGGVLLIEEVVLRKGGANKTWYCWDIPRLDY